MTSQSLSNRMTHSIRMPPCLIDALGTMMLDQPTAAWGGCDSHTSLMIMITAYKKTETASSEAQSSAAPRQLPNDLS